MNKYTGIFFSLPLISAQRQCDKSQTTRFSNDDVVGVIDFVTQKNCQISDQKLTDSATLISNLDQHGCWCNVINNYMNQAHGQPMDEVDKSCRSWKQCNDCANDNYCNIVQSYTFDIRYDNQNDEFYCLGDACSSQYCMCHLELALSVSESLAARVYDDQKSCQNTGCLSMFVTLQNFKFGDQK